MTTATPFLRLPASACARLLDELPRAADANAALLLIESVRQSILGGGLLTVNLNLGQSKDHEAATADLVLRRLWTSNPQAYPISGYKRKSLTPWTRHLLVNARVFVGEGDSTLREVFDDHERIASLGLHSVVNVPLLDGAGNCFATFNVLGTQSRWTPEEIWLIKLLATLAMPAIQKKAAENPRQN